MSRKLRYLSLFSGVEAASLAFGPLGWEPIAFAEIDEFPAAVLAHHWPDVTNLGDVTKIDWGDFTERYGRPDVIVAGSPCTSFSIAGKRESLDGESRLMFEFIRAVDSVKPEWVIFENVPAILSTKDDAFGQLLSEMERIGYTDLAWRVLDAQYARTPLRDGDGRITGWFGPVPQRRRRLFLVGHFGGWGGFLSAAVLVESKGMYGDTPPSREKGEGAAADAVGSVGGSDSRGAVAFVQNQRDEVRLMGGDGQIASTLPAIQSGTHKQETLLCMASGQANAEIERGGVSPTLTVLHEVPIVVRQQATVPTSSQRSAQPTEASSSSTTSQSILDDSSSTIFSCLDNESGGGPQSTIVIDRAAFNQAYIAETEVMDTLVVRGPHAVAYSLPTGRT